jgi:hypothetical protein
VRKHRPRVKILIIATSGTFTDSGVKAIEAHNAEDALLEVEMWSRSTLESILARYSHIAQEFFGEA